MTRLAQITTPVDGFEPMPSPARFDAIVAASSRLRHGLNGLTLLSLLLFPLLGMYAQSVGAQAGAGQSAWQQPVRQAIDAGRYDDAVKLLRPAVQASDPAAMTQLAILHHFGNGVREDDTEAYRLFGLAAKRGDSTAMFWLGRMNLLGYGPPRGSPDADRDAAVWFFEAAQRGHAEAQYYLGLLFMAGTGVDKDPGEADKWIRRAAAGGHEPARQFIDGSGHAPTRR